MNKKIYYYGVEKDIKQEGLFPSYTMGCFVHNLLEGEDEQTVRKEIEARCTKNAGGMVVCSAWTGEPLKNFRTFYFIN